MNYYVVSYFYNSGKCKVKIYSEEQMKAENISFENESNNNFDRYVDKFDSYEKAKEFSSQKI